MISECCVKLCHCNTNTLFSLVSKLHANFGLTFALEIEHIICVIILYVFNIQSKTCLAVTF